MQKLWQKKLKLNFTKNVLDIVQFGSSVLELSEPNDIDIAVIFKHILLKDQIQESHEIKKQIEALTNLPVQVESFNIESLLDKTNFAREGILFNGKSIISKNNFAKKFGLTPKLRISYVLNNLEKKDKVRFNYLLNGKGGNYGLLRKFGGKIIYPGVVEIAPENESIFFNRMRKITDKLKVEKIFVLN